MNKIIFAVTGLFLIFAQQADAQYKWTDIQYHFQTGSVPPPYFYEYDVYISSSGTGAVVYHTGYGNDSTKKDFNYDFTLSSDDLTSLDDAIDESNVLTDTYETLDKHPIGGAMKNVFVTLPQDPRLDHKPPRIETPYFPKSKKQKKALGKLYDKIVALVPQSVWDDIESKKNK